MRSIVLFLVSVLVLLVVASTTFNQAQAALEPHQALINTNPITNDDDFFAVNEAYEALNNRFFLIRLFMRDELQQLSQRLETYDMPNINELDAFSEFLSDSNPRVTIEVANMGTMTLELFPEVAPNSVNNFINLIEQNYFDGLIFHRIIRGFMIQGGWGPETGCVIAGEFAANGFENPLKHTRGVLSMARTNVMNSATSQFFIMHRDSPHLDRQYAAFGALVEGFDVLDRIANVTTGAQDRPVNDVVMTRVTVDLRGFTPEPTVCVTS